MLDLGNFQKHNTQRSYSKNIFKKLKVGGVRVRQFSKNQKLVELELEFFSKTKSE
jgi:hypothetical protein